MNTINSTELTTDIAIIGGGIAGLVLQHRLNNLGFSTLLLEQDQLGSGQTSKSQGIIHGGIKYALLGQITDAAAAISEQTTVWQNYFNFKTNKNNNNINNQINLSNTKILSNHHDLWNNGDLQTKLKQIVMQKTLSSSGDTLDKKNNDYPIVFKNPKFKGNIYRVNETVVDVFSLMHNLANPNQDKIIKIDQDSLKINSDLPINNTSNQLNTINNLHHITFTQNNSHYNLKATQYIFTAGQNNQQILDLIPDLPRMQIRPLQMVMAKFPEPNILYGHYIGKSMLPQLTITTHRAKDGDYIWYIGGQIAETGIYLDSAQQIVQAKVEISNIFPWLNTSHWQWASFMVNRAEPLQHNNKRPDHACFSHHDNIIIGWPIKMTLAPMLADKIIDHFKNNNIIPKHPQININDFKLKTATIAEPIWDKLYASTTSTV